MSQTPRELFEQAESLFINKEYSQVISLLTDNVLDDYNDASLYSLRSKAHGELGEKDLQVTYAQKALSANYSIVSSYITSGNDLYAQHNFKGAIDEYTKAIELNENSSIAYHNRGLAWQASKDYPKAIDDYNKAISLDDKYTDAYNNRGIVWYNMGDYSKSMEDYNKAIQLNDKYALVYNNRGLVWQALKDYTKAIDDYSKAILFDDKYTDAYYNRGNAYYASYNYQKAIEDFNKVVTLDDKYTDAYVSRGNAWYALNNYKNAIADYDKAIQLDENYAIPFNNEGLAWYALKDYKTAAAYYDKAILLDDKYIDAWYNRGNALYYLGEYKRSIADYDKAIQLDEKYANAYYTRALSYKELSDYQQAIKDYKRYIELLNNPEDYYTQVAKKDIEELNKKIENDWYDKIDGLVNRIKQILLFNDPCISHYTSLSGAKAMILDNSSFRLSEGVFLNDTSEGREIFKYLSFADIKADTDETIAKPFAERPFIGSFVADTKHDDLTLWRMYGKEAQAEAKGCALTIHKEQFIDNLKKKMKLTDLRTDSGSQTEGQFTKAGIRTDSSSQTEGQSTKQDTTLIKSMTESGSQTEGQFTFYRVAYMNKDEFIIPSSSDDLTKQLNDTMRELKDAINNLDVTQRQSITKLLNDIAYLFKRSEYQFEFEVRLVVQGVGFKKEINKDAAPPKVYIELVEIAPTLRKITLGPKVERAEEWAAAFNYHIKEQFKDKKDAVEIVISHLPFK